MAHQADVFSFTNEVISGPDASLFSGTIGTGGVSVGFSVSQNGLNINLSGNITGVGFVVPGDAIITEVDPLMTANGSATGAAQGSINSPGAGNFSPILATGVGGSFSETNAIGPGSGGPLTIAEVEALTLGYELRGVSTTDPPTGGITFSILFFFLRVFYVLLRTTNASPATGDVNGGTVVSINGLGFLDNDLTVTNVYFDGIQATNISVSNDLFLTCTAPAHAVGTIDVVVELDNGTYTSTLTNGFTYTGNSWWQLPTATEPFLKPGDTINGEDVDWPIFDGTIDGHSVQYTAPDQFITICGTQYPLASFIMTPDCGDFTISFIPQVDFTDTFNWYYFGQQPTSAWTQVDPTPQGWWWSIEGFQGGANVTVDGRPKNPRGFVKIAAFAAGNANVFGGSPSCGVIVNNHLIYAGNDYTLGTTSPTIRTFDGRSDRQLLTIPNTTAGAVPKGILSMLAANGVIYVSTLDSGTTAADFAGRVFTLDPLSAQLSVVGDAVFTTGHLPYALAWHMGRLWVGTNKGDGTAGKIYYFRPNIDTAWTQDYSLATSTAGGAVSMFSYKGKLMVGTDNADAVFAKVLARDSAGAYTTSLTATGGTAKVNNGFLAMTQFGDNLYASYFNNDATKISKIYKFDNTSWTTVYNGASGTLRPYLGMFVESGKLYAIGGGLLLAASLIQTTNGSSWTDLTAFLNQGPTNSTGLPIFGTVSS